jgi:aspartate/methionine/tyrosine aminotransferase
MTDTRASLIPDLVTFEAVSDKYGIPLRSMKEAARAGKFTHIHIGNAWRMTPEHVTEFLATRTRKRKPAQDSLGITRARHERKVARKAGRRASAA